MHFFDGFRTSHEVAKIEQVPVEVVRELIDDQLVFAHRARALTPDHPFIRGTSQNPDVYFQARESVNPFYQRMPAIVQRTMDKFAGLTGRRYRIYEYDGAPDADRVIVLMGSGAEAVEEVVDHLNHHGEKTGVVKVRSVPPVRGRRVAQGHPRHREMHRRAGQNQGTGRGRRAAVQGCGDGDSARLIAAERAGSPGCRAWWAGAMDSPPRNSRRAWSRACSTN